MIKIDKRENKLESDPAYNQIKAQIESEYQKRKNQLRDELRREKNKIADNLETLRGYLDAKVISLEEYNSLKSKYWTMSNQLTTNYAQKEMYLNEDKRGKLDNLFNSYIRK